MRHNLLAAATFFALTILVPSGRTHAQSPAVPAFGRESLRPVANAGLNQTVKLGSTVVLNGGASANLNGVGRLTYSWSLASVPQGSKAVLADADTVTPSFVADVAGDYVVALSVGNGRAKDRALVVISTIKSAPTAVAGPNQTAAPGSLVSLDGSASYDPDGNPITYSWSLVGTPAGSSASLSDGSSPSPTLLTDKAGSYVVQLTVNDGHVNSPPSRVTITTRNTPPVADTGMNQHVGVGSVVQLDGSASSDINGDSISYKWSIISSPAHSRATLSDPSAVTPTFSADVAGTYVAQLVVNDGKADSVPATVVITTNAILPPVARAGKRQIVEPGTGVTLSGSATDPQGLPVTLHWALISVPRGSSAVLSNAHGRYPTFVPDVQGVYVAQLVAKNEFVSSIPSTVTTLVSNAAGSLGGHTKNAPLAAAAASPAISVNNVTIGKNLESQILVKLNPAPPISGVNVTIASSDPTKALVGNSRSSLTVKITPGSNPFSVSVEALAGAGTTTVKVSAPGYASGTSTVTFAHSGFVIAGSHGIGGAITTFEGVSTPLTVSSGYLNPAGSFVSAEAVRPGVTVSVPVTSSVAAIGTILGSPVVFTGGVEHVIATFKASSIHTGNTGVMLGTPGGFSTPIRGITLEVTVQKAGLIAFTTTVGQKLEQGLNISLSAAAPTNVLVTLTSNNPAKLKFSNARDQAGSGSISFTIPINHAVSPAFFVQGFAASGSAGYTASAGTFGTVNGTVFFAPTGLAIESPTGLNANFSATTKDPAANLTILTGYLNSTGRFVQQQPVVPGASVQVAISSSNTGVGTITSSPLTIAGGTASAATGFQPRATGTAVITASAAGFKSAQVTATVTPHISPLLFTDGEANIGKDLEAQFTVNLPGQAGSAGVPITIQSNSGSLVLAPTATAAGTPQVTVTVPANQRSATFYVQALGSAGTASFTAKAAGFQSTTLPVTLVPSGVFLLPPSVSGPAGSTLNTVTINTAALDPTNGDAILAQEMLAGGRPPLAVSINSTNSSVASVPGTVSIAPGTTSSGVPVHLGSAGTATISVTQPAGFTQPALGRTTAVTVH